MKNSFYPRQLTIGTLCLLTFVVGFIVCSPTVFANPMGGEVAAGSATIGAVDASTLQINQMTDQVIINWQDFSIGAGEVTQFVQPSSTSAALNRVVTGNPSALFGQLQANGEIILINPNGIMVGTGGQIDTASFIASTFDITDASFAAGGDLLFVGDSTAAIQNLGKIGAFENDVFLIAHIVENGGEIRAANGTVGLAAGTDVILVEEGVQRLAVQAASVADESATEVGVNNQGLIEATEVELRGAGGNIYALAINNEGVVRANTFSGDGGKIILRSDTGVVVSRGLLNASGKADGTSGGEVRVLGERVGLFGDAVVDVSGESGGGVALIGGDYQGNNAEVPNAAVTLVGSDTEIKADAGSRGDGGRVIVWADEVTRFYGAITARGGANGGDGGFAEVSGKQSLDFQGTANLLAPLGDTGTLLLDPTDITIINGIGPGTLDGGLPGILVGELDIGGNTIAEETLEALLADANIILQATDFITINNLNDNVLDLSLISGSLTIDAGGAFSMNANDTIQTAGGDVSIAGAGIILGGIHTMGGDLSLTSTGGNVAGGGDLLVTTGVTTLSAAGNNITLNSAGNDFGTVIVTAANDVTLVDANAIELGASTMSGTLDVDAKGSVTQSGLLTVMGTTLITISDNVGGDLRDILLADFANDFGGLVVIEEVSAGDVRDVALRNVSTTASFPAFFSLDSGSDVQNLTLIYDNAPIVLGETPLTGDLNVTAGGAITQSGTISVAGGAIFSAVGFDITLDSAGNDFVTVNIVDGANVVVTDVNAIDLGALTVTGTLDVTAGGNITQSATLDVAGVSTFAAVGFDITLTDVANDFTSVGATGVNVAVTDIDDVVLGASAVAGNFDVTVGGEITQSDGLVVIGTAILDNFGFGDITLTDAANDFTTVGATGANVAVADIDDIELGALTVAGDFAVTAGGAITQSGLLDVNGASTFTVTAAATDVLLSPSPSFDNVLDGLVSFVESGGTFRDISLRNVSLSATMPTLPSNLQNLTLDLTQVAVDLPALTLSEGITLFAGGDITQNSGTLSVAGTASFSTINSNDIILTGDNDFSTVIIDPFGTSDTANATINDVNEVKLGASTVTGDFAVTAGGAITQSGALTVNGVGALSIFTAAGNNITLTDGGNDFVTVITSGADITVTDANAIELGASTVTGGFDVTAGGNITQSGVLGVVGASTFTVNDNVGDILLADFANDFGGSVVVAEAGTGDVGDVALQNVSATASFPAFFSLDSGSDLNDLTLIYDNAGISLGVLGLTGGLNVTAGGNITQSAPLTVAGVSTFSATGFDITLDSAGNDFATVSASGNNVAVTDVNGVDFAASTVTGNFAVTAGGVVTQSAAIVVAGLELLGTGSFTLENVGNDVNTLAANVSGSVSFVDSDDLTIGMVDSTAGLTTVDSDVSIETGTALTIDGAISIGTGNLTLTLPGGATQNFGNPIVAAGLEVLGVGSFLVADNNNDIDTLAANISGDLNFRDLDGFSVGTVNMTEGIIQIGDGPLVLAAGDAITQTDPINIGAAQLTAITFNDAGAEINLGNAGNVVGPIDLESLTSDSADAAGPITFQNNGDIDITLLRTTSTADITATGGQITQSQTLMLSGAASFTADSIFLDTFAANDFSSVALSASGDAFVSDANGINLGGSAIGGEFDVIANGSVTQSGAISMTGGGDASITAGAANDIVLNDAGNDFANIFITSGNNVILQDANALILGSSTISGDFDVTIDGAITQSGILLANGTGAVATLSAGSANDIMLSNSGNDFTTVSIGSGNDVEICDVNGVELGTSSISGDLTICVNGEITQSGVITAAAGTTTLSAGGTTADIILGNTMNDFDTVIITPNEANNVTISDANNLILSLSIPGTLDGTVQGTLTKGDTFEVFGGQLIIEDVSGLINSIGTISSLLDLVTFKEQEEFFPSRAGFSAGVIDPGAFRDVISPWSVWTSFLEVPFSKKQARRYL